MNSGQRLARFAPGAVVGLLWGIFLLLLESLVGAATLLRAVLDATTRILPVGLFGWLLGRAESAAKPLAVVGTLAMFTLVAGVLTLVLRGRTRIWLLGALALVLWSGTVWVAYEYGEALTTALFVASSSTFFLVGGLWIVSAEAQQSSRTRRRLLRTFLGAGLVLGLATAGRFLIGLRARSRAPRAVDERGLSPAITPLADFYVVSKNVADPEVDLARWRLRVIGRVRRPLDVDLAALRSRPAVRMVSTLECISNDVWGPYISTGEWIGLRLRDLLLEAEPVDPLVDVVLRAADEYSDSIPFSVALDPAVLLAYGLNGESLPREHGFPLRLVVPGIYGMKNVKWITEIELVDFDYLGYWQQRGWSDSAIVQIHSRIDTPRGGSVLTVGQEVLVGGIAFAGTRGIQRVEVSVDGGATWRPAELESPLSPYSWVRWWITWRPNQEGRARLVVRAWDGDGRLQEERERPPLPDGATGWHRITVDVRART